MDDVVFVQMLGMLLTRASSDTDLGSEAVACDCHPEMGRTPLEALSHKSNDPLFRGLPWAKPRVVPIATTVLVFWSTCTVVLGPYDRIATDRSVRGTEMSQRAASLVLGSFSRRGQSRDRCATGVPTAHLHPHRCPHFSPPGRASAKRVAKRCARFGAACAQACRGRIWKRCVSGCKAVCWIH